LELRGHSVHDQLCQNAVGQDTEEARGEARRQTVR
jgi:hypothetical protein